MFKSLKVRSVFWFKGEYELAIYYSIIKCQTPKSEHINFLWLNRHQYQVRLVIPKSK
jgi:hypothetical protein